MPKDKQNDRLSAVAGHASRNTSKHSNPGHCIALDTIVRYQHGVRRHVLTAIDVYTRMAIATATNRCNSCNAAAFLRLTLAVLLQPVKYILTDGGSEFQGQFARLIRESPVIEQWLTYPKCPKMNAHIERFNRTVQEDCIDHAEDLLFADTEAFNDWL